MLAQGAAEAGMQRTGVGAVARALDAGEAVTVVLVERGWQESSDADLIAVVRRAQSQGATVRAVGERDLWRMRAARGDDSGPARVLGLVGRMPDADLDGLLASPGDGRAMWLLVGLRYPSNVGYVIRTAEVSGAAAVVVDGGGRMGRREREQAMRVSMGAHRFLPVIWGDAEETLRRSGEAGFRRILLEDDGDHAPWEVDLTGDVALVVGAEDDGTPAGIRALCDDVVRVPMAGFVPSYSVQAPVAAVAVERLRQLATPPR